MQTLDIPNDLVLFTFDKTQDYVPRRFVKFLGTYKWQSLNVHGKGWVIYGKKKGRWYEKEIILGFLERKFGPRYAVIMDNIVMAENGCWYWKGGSNENDYPQVPCGFPHRHSGQTQSAHYLFFALVFGHRPERIHMTCKNGRCLRPSHMRESHYGENPAL